MRESEKYQKKEIMISIITIILLVIAVIGVTYAAFTFTGHGTKENKLSTGEVEFSYYEKTNGISIVNAEPISDSVGKMLVESDVDKGIENGYFDFTISSSVSGDAVRYEIYGVEDSSLPDAMDSEYVKVYLTNADTEEAMTGYTDVVPTFKSLPPADASQDDDARRLYYGSFDHGVGIHRYRLRIWVSDEYTLNDVTKTFQMKVNVKASS